MIKVDWVGFESRFDFGHNLGVEVEDVNGLQVHGVLGDVVSKFVRYVMLNSEGRHLKMAWLRVVLRTILCTVEMLW